MTLEQIKAKKNVLDKLENIKGGDAAGCHAQRPGLGHDNNGGSVIKEG